MTYSLQQPSKAPQIDPSTNSNYRNFTVANTVLRLTVSFDEKALHGEVIFHLKNEANSDKVILDTSYLTIHSTAVDGAQTDFELRPRIGPLGSPLVIPVPKKEAISVSVKFSTTDKCTAIQFIKGDTGPYLFSQCQFIHARSMFPCFDTPGFKSTYDFTVYSPLPSLMSGRPISQEAGSYRFKQPVPIPSYLVAIASGNIVSEPIGPRSKVYSETPNIAECKWEFEQDMESFIQVAENLIFKYEWERYDALILPASFPYGGMENPNITFATPTLICGDRSQIKVMAHELAHSWAGNLVTNCSWEHFWLNEGWTVYLERRILGKVAELEARKSHGADPEKAGELYRHFSSILGWNGLVDTVKTVEPKTTSLIWDLSNNVDPDDFYSRIPYEKGFNFIFYLEQKLGGTKDFDPFIPHYFETFRYKSIDSYQFIDELYTFFTPRGKKEVLDCIDFQSWLLGQGMPPVTPEFDTSLADQCTILATKLVEYMLHGDLADFANNFDQEGDVGAFDPNQSAVFVDTLVEKLNSVKVKPEFIKALPDIYSDYAQTKNNEIKFSFNALLLKYGNYKATDAVVTNFAEWLGSVGRMKYVRPGYKLLQLVSHEFAVDTFAKYEARYHPICRTLVKKDLGIDSL